MSFSDPESAAVAEKLRNTSTAMAATDLESGIRPKDFLKAVFVGNLMLLKKLVPETGNGNGGEGLTKAYEKVAVVGGRNGLHLAAAVGNVQICKYLVENLKFDIDRRDYLGNTPLLVAILEQCHPTAEYLIENGAGIGCLNYSGFTPLHLAAQKGQKEILRLLLSKGAKATDLNSATGTPLHCASSTDFVKILLHHGADVNSVTKLRSSPLMQSIIDVSYERMELLLKAGADPNLGYSGKTPLILAARVLDARFIERLLKAGANPNVVDSFGVTPLEHAASHGNVDAVKALFPCTTSISLFPDWSVNGIMKHVQSKKGKRQLEIRRKNNFEVSKAKGREAFERKDYEVAIQWYSQAIGADPTDATVLSNRSLCWLMLNLGCHAERDAKACVALKPDWPKAHYRKGAALMLLQEYSEASEAFSKALKLDPNNMELKKAHREAVEADLSRPLSEKIPNLQI